MKVRSRRSKAVLESNDEFTIAQWRKWGYTEIEPATERKSKKKPKSAPKPETEAPDEESGEEAE